MCVTWGSLQASETCEVAGTQSVDAMPDNSERDTDATPSEAPYVEE